VRHLSKKAVHISREIGSRIIRAMAAGFGRTDVDHAAGGAGTNAGIRFETAPLR
jgi:hypothetical protein